jgi:hypothetical protein
MESKITQRRAIGLLVVFATVLTVIAAWNLRETGGTER